MAVLYRFQIIKRMKQRIASCYDSLLKSRAKNFPELYTEGFRCRLDELLLLYHLTEDITLVEACRNLGIKYEDVNIQDPKLFAKKGKGDRK